MVDLTKYSNQIEQSGLKLYQTDFEQDNLLLKLWLHLVESGDLYRLLPLGSHPLSSFFKLFQGNVLTIYCLDNAGIWFIAWFTPISRSSKTSSFSHWTRKDKRGSRNWMQALDLTYKIAFDIWESLFGITQQIELLETHKKTGYNIVGTVKGLLEPGKDSFLVQLTRENFLVSKFHQLAQRSNSHG